MMNEGVKILLERIKTNPDEFIDYPTEPHIRSKWGEIISDHVVYLDPEDREALNQAVAKIHQQRFTELVMKELLAPEEDDGLGKWYTKQGNITLSAGQTQGVSLNSGAVSGAVSVGGTWGNSPYATSATINTNSLTLGTATLTDTKLHELLHMKAQLESERQKQKKHQTLFGKLFNYS